MDEIRRIASREVYRNDWMTVREDQVRRPDGSDGIYGVVDKPTYALIIARDGDRFRLVEQFRYPLGLRRWEFPQGTAPGRAHLEPAELAHRELREETGLRAESMVPIGLLDVAAGMSSQRGRVFVATGITEGEHDREHTEQDMHSEWFSRAEVEQMMRDGDITDAQSLAAWALFLLSERSRRTPRPGRPAPTPRPPFVSVGGHGLIIRRIAVSGGYAMALVRAVLRRVCMALFAAGLVGANVFGHAGGRCRRPDLEREVTPCCATRARRRAPAWLPANPSRTSATSTPS